MAQTEAQKRASAKYHAKNYKSFTVNARIAEYKIITNYCEKFGISRNQLMIKACMEWIKNHPIDNTGNK